MDKSLRILKSQGLSLAIKTATGENPIVTDYSNYSELSFSPEQVKRLRTKLKKTLSSAMSAAPGDVRVNIAPVVVPVVLEKVLPLALVGLVGVYLLGRYRVIY